MKQACVAAPDAVGGAGYSVVNHIIDGDVVTEDGYVHSKNGDVARWFYSIQGVEMFGVPPRLWAGYTHLPLCSVEQRCHNISSRSYDASDRIYKETVELLEACRDHYAIDSDGFKYSLYKGGVCYSFQKEGQKKRNVKLGNHLSLLERRSNELLERARIANYVLGKAIDAWIRREMQSKPPFHGDVWLLWFKDRCYIYRFASNGDYVEPEEIAWPADTQRHIRFLTE